MNAASSSSNHHTQKSGGSNNSGTSVGGGSSSAGGSAKMALIAALHGGSQILASSSSSSGGSSSTRTAITAAATAGGSFAIGHGRRNRAHDAGHVPLEELPNYIAYKKMEHLILAAQDEQTGVPVRTVKGIMSKIPSVFTGADIVQWLQRHFANNNNTDSNMPGVAASNLTLNTYSNNTTNITNSSSNDQPAVEALHLANLLCSHGYFFPIDDHRSANFMVRGSDSVFYRFQTPYFWPSNWWEPENIDYAVYLCKRTMQSGKSRVELSDLEAENLARLQKMFSRKWEFIFMQAEAQAKVDKKREKLERIVLDSQERAFWDVHRPVPSAVNTTEADLKKVCRINQQPQQRAAVAAAASAAAAKAFSLRAGFTGRLSPSSSEQDLSLNAAALQKEADMLRKRLSKRQLRVQDLAQHHINYCLQFNEYDALAPPGEASNPWLTDNADYWTLNSSTTTRDPSGKRVRRWAFSLRDLLKDPVGRDFFIKFLEKEFSSENLRFYEAVQELKRNTPSSEATRKANQIYSEFLADNCQAPINIDSRAADYVKKLYKKAPSRECFDRAAEHIYHLMRSDSYTRFLRSDVYKEMSVTTKKKASVRGLRSVISFPGRKAVDQAPKQQQQAVITENQ